MTNLEQTALIVIGAIVTIVAILFIQSPSVGDAAMLGYLTALGGYLSLSFAKTVVQSGTLPKNEFADGNKWRYYLGMFLILGIYAAVAFSDKAFTVGPEALTAAFFVVLGGLVSMIQANKIATLKDGLK